MNPIDTLPPWAAVPVALLLLLGGGASLVGAVGLLRLPTFYQRIHGPAVIVALGAGCIVAASMLYFTVLEQRLVIHELLIGALVLMTAPVVAMQLIRMAVHRDLAAGAAQPGGPHELYRSADRPADG
jgi:multicomponent K+:H+ antiporter subunit G